MSVRAFFFVRIYRNFNFVLYDAVPPYDTQLPSEALFATTIYTYILKEVVYHRGGNSIVYEKIEISIYSYKEMPR